MTLLNGYCYSIQSLSERTQFEHFLSENLINLSKKDKLQLQGMKKMIGQLSNINENVSGLSKEVMMLKDSIRDVKNTVSSLEYSVDDMRYSVDDIKYDIKDSQKRT
jgi:peptidoglycan hydrolase CwlO-like protein